MSISFLSERSFPYTHAVIALSNQQWKEGGIYKKITAVVSIILATLPALGLDLAVRLFHPTPPIPAEPKQFLKDAIKNAFNRQNRRTKNLYKTLIRNEGMADAGDPPICIYQWISTCLIAHYLKVRSEENAEPLNQLIFNNIEIDCIWRHYQSLGPERHRVLAAIIIPTSPQALSEAGKRLVHHIHAEAIRMLQQRQYLKEILGPVMGDAPFVASLA